MTQEKKPQLVHTARQMFETRLAKYNDPHNLEWDFDDITDKWERHAWSAFLDLQSTEAERDALLSEVARLREVLGPLVNRIDKMMENGPDCGCPAEGHLCGWIHLQLEMDAARAVLGKET
jgi:hypothetical protein